MLTLHADHLQASNLLLQARSDGTIRHTSKRQSDEGATGQQDTLTQSQLNSNRSSTALALKLTLIEQMVQQF